MTSRNSAAVQADVDTGITLQAAVQRWCAPALRTILAIQQQRVLEAPVRIALEERHGRPSGHESRSLAKEIDALEKFERAVITDMRVRLERGEFQLRGVPTRPVPSMESEPIPGIWAADFQFELDANTVQFHDRRYVAVRAYPNTGKDMPTVTLAPITGLVRLSPENVGELDDETVLLLLEQHGQRVAEGRALPLIQPSKVSFGPILCRHMEWRAKQGYLASTLRAECRALVAWLGDRIKHHQIPTARAAEAPLRDCYRALKAGTTA